MLRNIKKISVLSILLIIGLCDNFANQWEFELNFNIDTIYYELDIEDIQSGAKIDFYFPSYKTFEQAKNKCIKANKLKYDENFKYEFKQNKYLEISIRLNNCQVDSNVINNLKIEADLFTKNIDSIYIFIKSQNKSWILIEKRSNNNSFSFQPPIISQKIQQFLDKKQINISELKIVGRKNDFNNSRLILGNLIISSVRNRKIKIDNSWREEYKINWTTKINKLLQQPGIYFELPNMIERYGQTIGDLKLLIPDSIKNSKKEIICIASFVNDIITKYEFIKEKGINSQVLINENLQLADKSCSLDQYYEGLKNIIAKLEDSHYRLTFQNDYEEISSEPIRFYKTLAGIQVVAVFDSLLAREIHLGDRLVEVNAISIDSLLIKFRHKVFASSSQQAEYKILQSLLKFSMSNFNSTLELQLMDSDNNNYLITIDSTKLFFKAKYIPSNFKRSNSLSFEYYNDYTYLRPLFYEPYFIPFLNSKIEELKMSKGLILDFRGISSSDWSFEYLFSFLINSPAPMLKTPVIHLIDPFVNTCNYFTNVIKPSYYYYNKPIVILIDARTTCSSELFIKALQKQRKDVFTMGISNTAGAAQLSRRIILPCTEKKNSVELYFFNHRVYDANNEVVDLYGGIKPDILTFFSDYLELMPYNDKLLTDAIKFLDLLNKK